MGIIAWFSAEGGLIYTILVAGVGCDPDLDLPEVHRRARVSSTDTVRLEFDRRTVSPHFTISVNVSHSRAVLRFAFRMLSQLQPFLPPLSAAM